MAERPIFLPVRQGEILVEEVFLSLHWHGGFAPIQKQKNISELHQSAARAGLRPILEVSTKSSVEVGRQLSAFNLQLLSDRYGWLPLESVFQGSKVFEMGGPFEDLYEVEPRVARADERLRSKGKIIGFQFNDQSFPVEPKTMFYDWLYLNAIYEHRECLSQLVQYSGFSDIEFNPSRSINCQARSMALFVALFERKLLREALSSPAQFRDVLNSFHYRPALHQAALSKETMEQRVIA
jgi:hypothetical protein